MINFDQIKGCTHNVGTICGKSREVVEMLSRRASVDLCCIQNFRWREVSARMINGKDRMYKFFWVGKPDDTSGVGILLKKKWVEQVVDVNQVNDRIIVINVLVGSTVVSVVCVYAPQLDENTKKLISSLTNFWSLFLSLIRRKPLF